MLSFNNIKNKSESYAKLMRDNFPDAFENPKTNKFLNEYISNDEKSIFVEEIVKQNKINEFKVFVNSKMGKELLGDIDTGKSVKDLFDEAGYDFHITKTKADVENFKDYYKDGEKLCTFNNISGRLSDFNVFWITKKNINNITRNANPSRQDEYGTSCCSIQISKNGGDYISIKNRYNHTVSNPDNTFSNNLENIIPGLNKAFLKDFNINLKTQQVENKFELNNFTETNDGLMYFNFERDNIYFGINKTANRGVITTYDKDKYLLVDNYLINKNTKEVKDMLGEDDDFIELYNNGSINIKTDKKNRITEISGDIEKIGNNFLYYNTSLKEIDLPNVENIGDKFLFNNTSLEKIILPNLEKIGNNFLYYNTSLEKIELPNIEKIGCDFLYNNTSLEKIILPNLEKIGGDFLYNNEKLEKIELPNIEKIGGDFLYNNEKLEELNLANLKEVGDYFLFGNEKLEELNLPNLKEVGYDFLYNNKNIKELNLHNLKEVGNKFLYFNEKLEELNLPNLKKVGYDFLSDNKNIKKLNLPNIKKIGDYFLYNNEKLEELNLPNLKEVGNKFLYNNKNIKELNLPILKEVGDYFLYFNEKLEELNLPNLKKVGYDFLSDNKNIKKIL